MSESRTLPREEDQSRDHEEERMDSTVKEGKLQVGVGGKAKRTFLEEVEGSMSG